MEEHIIPEDELIQTRIEKLDGMKALGCDPFAVEKYERYASVTKADGSKEDFEPFSTDAMAAFEANEPPAHPEPVEGSEGPALEVNVSLAGRIVSFRAMGKASFAHIEDRKGKIQLYLKKDDLGNDYELAKLLDLGDFVGVEGYVFRTRMGEVSIHARKLTPLAKSIRPIPFGKEKGEQHWYGLHDVEQRYRQRYLDLITSTESRRTFERRSKIVRAVREFYDNRGYLEVETPVLQSVAGGAAARPFNTHHNALDHDFHLRISLELYLKRLIVGGLERVYEIGRVFRNEGMSPRHNPEFTLLESYEAYADLDDVMQLVEDMYRHICQTLYGTTSFEYQGETLELAGKWPRLPMLQGIEQYAGIKPEAFETLESALKAMESVGLDTSQEHMIGGIIEKIHERFVQPNLVQPTFITDFPIETSPLAKKKVDNPRLTRRFEVYMGKIECGNAFSEINDPVDQRERFDQQGEMRAEGDEEAHPMDEDFIRSLEYGMPPTGGLGVGIDRLVMIFCNQDNVRDIILFPQMKPEKQL